ncbi:MAG: carotenoid biosynthesis protein [Promethearchaeia archaeon]
MTSKNTNAKNVFRVMILAIFVLSFIVIIISVINPCILENNVEFWMFLLFSLMIILFLSHSFQVRTVKSSIIFLIFTFIFSLFMEIIGSNYGIPFGKYHYTENIPIHIWGVPIFVPLTWYMIIYLSLQISYIILPLDSEEFNKLKKLYKDTSYSILTALITTAWDVILDPVAVGRENWVWEEKGQYFGIPLTNFLGWFVVAFIVSFIFLSLFENQKDLKFDDLELDIKWFPNIIYFLLFVGMALRAWNLGHPEYIFIGFMAMGPFMIISSLKLLWNTTSKI